MGEDIDRGTWRRGILGGLLIEELREEGYWVRILIEELREEEYCGRY